MIPLIDSAKSAQENYDMLWARYVSETKHCTVQHELLDALADGTWPSLQGWAEKHGITLKPDLYMNGVDEAIHAVLKLRRA